MRRVKSPKQNEKPLRIEPKRKCGGSARWQRSGQETMTKVLQHVALHLLWELLPKAQFGQTPEFRIATQVCPLRDGAGEKRRCCSVEFRRSRPGRAAAGLALRDCLTFPRVAPSSATTRPAGRSCQFSQSLAQSRQGQSLFSDACTLAGPACAEPADGVVKPRRCSRFYAIRGDPRAIDMLRCD